MKINEVTEGPYDMSPFAKKMASYGRTLQQMGIGTGEPGSLAKMSDEDLGMMNKMGTVGDALTRVGANFGIKDPTKGDGSPDQRLAKFFSELENKCNCDKATIMKLIKKAEQAGDMKANVPDPEPQDEPEDDFDGPSDDKIARQADARAAKRK